MRTKMLVMLLICLSTIFIIRTQAQTPGFLWAEQIGGDSLIQPTKVAVDFEGNQIITGFFKGTADFDPGVGVFELTSAGKEDIFIQKLSPSGSLLWAARMGDYSTDKGADVVTDASGNIYLTGYFWGTIDADPGPGVFNLYQNRFTAMVLKIQPDGNLSWARQMGAGDMGHVYGYGITVDNNLNVITCGTFLGKVDFDPGSGTSYLTSTNMSYTDVYVHKLDASGNFLWVKQISGASYENCYSLATDAGGNIYATGWFTGTVDFNPDRKLKYNLISYGDYDSFILKLDGNGQFLWAKQVGGTNSDGSYSIVLDNNNNLLTTGWFYGTADFNPGSGTYNMTPAGQDDAYLLKLTTGGVFLWAKQFGGTSWDAGHEVVLDDAGDIYVGGFFHATADFDPGAGTYYLTAEGYDDSFIVKTDPDGNFLWVSQTGGPGWDYNLTLDLDAEGNIFNVGNFLETVDFNPDGNGAFFMTNAGERDMFIQKLSPSGGSNCPVPNGLMATYDGTAALLSWNAVGSSGYFIRYREINSADWIQVPDLISGTSYSLSGLTVGVSYEFQVKTDCESNYSYSFEFITSVPECTDIYEPNESMAASPVIPINTDIMAMISSYPDIDWFHFTSAASAKNVHIILTNLPADYNVALYSGDGTLLGSSTNPGTADESIIYNSNKVRIYYVCVYGYQGVYDPINCYTLHVDLSSTGFKSTEAESFSPVENEELTVYPNPSNSAFNLSIQTESKEPATLKLYDVSGRLVTEYRSLSPDAIFTFGENLEYGVYIAVVTQGTQQKFVKLAKVR
jgi:hypothetical protein